jgi:hypothetical protein
MSAKISRANTNQTIGYGYALSVGLSLGPNQFCPVSVSMCKRETGRRQASTTGNLLEAVRALPIDLRAAVTWTGKNPSNGTAADDRMPSRPAHNRGAERTGCGRGRGHVRRPDRHADNVSAHRADPGVNPLAVARSTRWAVNLLCWVGTGAGELGGPQSEHTDRHRPPVAPENTKWA